MSYFIDVSYDCLNKQGEELCGDKVDIIRTEDATIVVLADGLGSGVKANILATLTSKILVTMLKEGASIDETIDTIVGTLPVCKVRNIAYATFSIIKIYNDGRVYIVEYDNPPVFYMKGDKLINFERKSKVVQGKVVKESSFQLELGDILTMVSDGVIHAGVGYILNLGWQWENVADYLVKRTSKYVCAKHLTKDLIEVCRDLYANKPGDDATVAAIKLRRPEVVNMFTGPPINREVDKWIVEKLRKSSGKKVVCGGTAANIVERELGMTMRVDMEYIDPEIPPTASIYGIDLVTEGVLTLSKTLDKIKKYSNPVAGENITQLFSGRDGASRLGKILVEECTHINLWVGKAINPAHQNPNFPADLSIKLKIVDELVAMLKRLGKNVEVNYI